MHMRYCYPHDRLYPAGSQCPECAVNENTRELADEIALEQQEGQG